MSLSRLSQAPGRTGHISVTILWFIDSAAVYFVSREDEHTTRGFLTNLGPSGAQLTGTPHPSVLVRDWSSGSLQHLCLCYLSTRHLITQVFGGTMGSFFIVATFYLNISLLSARTVFCYSMVMLHGTETKTHAPTAHPVTFLPQPRSDKSTCSKPVSQIP